MVFLDSLQDCLNHFRVTRPLRLLDCACGDMAWSWQWVVQETKLARLEYTGIDIAPGPVAAARRRIGTFGRLLMLDIAEHNLETAVGPMDLVLSKDTLNHMSPDLAVQALRAFSKVSSWLLINNHPGTYAAQELASWGQNWRPYDYGLPPFNLQLARVVQESAACGKTNKRMKENVSLFRLHSADIWSDKFVAYQ